MLPGRTNGRTDGRTDERTNNGFKAQTHQHLSTHGRLDPKAWRMTNTNGEMDLSPDIIVSAKADGASKIRRVMFIWT